MTRELLPYVPQRRPLAGPDVRHYGRGVLPLGTVLHRGQHGVDGVVDVDVVAHVVLETFLGAVVLAVAAAGQERHGQVVHLRVGTAPRPVDREEPQPDRVDAVGRVVRGREHLVHELVGTVERRGCRDGEVLPERRGVGRVQRFAVLVDRCVGRGEPVVDLVGRRVDQVGEADRRGRRRGRRRRVRLLLRRRRLTA